MGRVNNEEGADTCTLHTVQCTDTFTDTCTLHSRHSNTFLQLKIQHFEPAIRLIVFDMSSVI